MVYYPNKQDAFPINLEEYKKIATLNLPRVAIGGITVSNFEFSLKCGAHGVAMGHGILGACDITKAVTTLKEYFNHQRD